MPIDTFQRIGATVQRAAGARSARGASPPVTRQELTAGGNVVPPAAAASHAKQADVQQAVTRLNGYVQSLRRDLQFTVDEESGRSIVKVIDSETGELIRQIPAEEILAVSRAISRTMGGLEGLIFHDQA
jgi:flagellar protein FlaG